MLEIRRTTDFQPDITALEAVIDGARLREADEIEDWPDDRLVMSECVVLNDGRVVGFGRLIWDAHLDVAPRIFDLCLLPEHRNTFVLDTLEQELIDEYAFAAEGGDIVIGREGDEIDISRRARELHDESLGRSPGRLRA
jgi:hypothetical protein